MLHHHGTIREIASGAHRSVTEIRDGALITDAIYPHAREGSVKLSMHHGRFENLNRSGLAGANAKALAWVWPWDLVAFATNAPGALVVMTQSNPNIVYTVADRLEQSGNCTPEACREVGAKLSDNSLLKTFFGRLGQHDQFKASYPNAAHWARVIGGEQPVSPMPQPEVIPPHNIVAIVGVVLGTMGITMIAAGILLVAAIVPLLSGLAASLAPFILMAIPLLVEILITCVLGLIFIGVIVTLVVVVAVCILIVVGLVTLSMTRLSVDEIADGWNWIEPQRAAAGLPA